jgi:ergothioneine biosynthesis protein EgtB
MNLRESYIRIRLRTEQICKPLQTEDYVVQPVVDVSPPKWHIGHTTWFFETFILKKYVDDYKEFDPSYNYVFNSYYETIGTRVIRTDRGNLSRPTVDDVYLYRKHVDHAMIHFLAEEISGEVKEVIALGLNHEEQHQELLCTDIKYILGHNPLFPAYDEQPMYETIRHATNNSFINIDAGLYEIGFDGDGFCFDNELARHKVYLQKFSIAKDIVRNKDFVKFIEAGGYSDFRFWHAEGWEWVKEKNITSPMYWHKINDAWHSYTLQGLKVIDMDEYLNHVSFYEASAYAAWAGMRLPTEFEWEVAAPQLQWGARWEWTESAYLPYPGYSKAPGAIGEYNGKFMVNQKVLRGSSQVTSPGHSRITYRNFFHPHLRWQYTGIRLVKL